MKVIHVIDTLAPGGAERVLVELVNGLVEEKVLAGVCVTRIADNLATQLASGTEVIVLNRIRRWDLAAIKAFINHCADQQVSILHAHGRGSVRFCTLVKALSRNRMKLVFHDHHGEIDLEKDVTPFLRLMVRMFVDKYICVSPELQRWAIEQVGLEPRLTMMLGNAIDCNRFDQARALGREGLGRIEQPLVAAVVANLRPQKDHELLFTALSKTSLAREVLHVLVVGTDLGDDYSRDCRRMVNELGLGRNISFLGSRIDVPQILRSVDFGLLCSKSESGPVTLLEYMACGLPFLVTSTGQIGQIVQGEGLPYFAPPGDVGRYAAALDELVALSGEQRRTLGDRGHDLVSRLFDIKKQVAVLKGVYTELCA